MTSLLILAQFDTSNVSLFIFILVVVRRLHRVNKWFKTVKKNIFFLIFGWTFYSSGKLHFSAANWHRVRRELLYWMQSNVVSFVSVISFLAADEQRHRQNIFRSNKSFLHSHRSAMKTWCVHSIGSLWVCIGTVECISENKSKMLSTKTTMSSNRYFICVWQAMQFLRLRPTLDGINSVTCAEATFSEWIIFGNFFSSM